MPFGRLFSMFRISFGTAPVAVLQSFDISFGSCICRYTWHPSYAACTYRLQSRGALAGCLLVCLPLHRRVPLSTLLQVGFSIYLMVCWPLWWNGGVPGLVDPRNCVDARYLGKIIAVPWAKFDNCSAGALGAAGRLYWWMHFAVLGSNTSGMLIVCGRVVLNSGTVIPLF